MIACIWGKELCEQAEDDPKDRRQASMPLVHYKITSAATEGLSRQPIIESIFETSTYEEAGITVIFNLFY